LDVSDRLFLPLEVAAPEGTDRKRIQLEVESVAYIVCDALGLDASSYSFKYVAAWSHGDLEKIKKAGERVVECAKGILGSLEPSDTRGESKLANEAYNACAAYPTPIVGGRAC